MGEGFAECFNRPKAKVPFKQCKGWTIAPEWCIAYSFNRPKAKVPFKHNNYVYRYEQFVLKSFNRPKAKVPFKLSIEFHIPKHYKITFQSP